MNANQIIAKAKRSATQVYRDGQKFFATLAPVEFDAVSEDVLGELSARGFHFTESELVWNRGAR